MVSAIDKAITCPYIRLHHLYASKHTGCFLFSSKVLTTPNTMASSTVAWMPSRGRHQINIGPSLGRAIKARKLKGSPAPTTKRSNLPERDFYAFRCTIEDFSPLQGRSLLPPLDNFKPGAIDSTKPASIEVKKTLENTQITAEFPSKEVCCSTGVFKTRF